MNWSGSTFTPDSDDPTGSEPPHCHPARLTQYAIQPPSTIRLMPLT